jgi:hypothetical protein
MKTLTELTASQKNLLNSEYDNSEFLGQDGLIRPVANLLAEWSDSISIVETAELLAEEYNVPVKFQGDNNDYPWYRNIQLALSHTKMQGWVSDYKTSSGTMFEITTDGIEMLNTGEPMLRVGHQGGGKDYTVNIQNDILGNDVEFYNAKNFPQSEELVSEVFNMLASVKTAINIASIITTIATEKKVATIFTLKGNVFSNNIILAINTLVAKKLVSFAGLKSVCITKKGRKAVS